jgi:hypothetical protein
MLIGIYHAAVRDSYEVTVAGREFCIGYAFDQLFMLSSICNEVFDRHDMQIVLFGEFLQVGHAAHRTVGSHNLADDTGGVQASQSSKVNTRLGMASSYQHTAIGVSQRENVTWPAQILWLGGGVDHRCDRC